MTPSPRRRVAGSRALTTSLALAASAVLAAAPGAAAQSTVEAGGAITVSSLGATNQIPAGSSGSLGSLAGPTYYDEYVALGDSYAALGDSRRATGDPLQCGRNLSNYPHLLDAVPAVGALTDATCGGAQIPGLAGSQTIDTPPNSVTVPPQFGALRPTTDLVTLSIGGNDVGFGTIVACITKRGDFATTPDCETAIGADIAADIDQTFGAGGAIDAVYAGIADRSPGATVVATQYMPLMPAEGGSCAFTARLNPADVQWAREVTEDINDAVDEAARRNGHVSVLPVDDVDRSACAPIDQRWTDFTGEAPGSAAMHPTALGQQAMADAVAAVL